MCVLTKVLGAWNQSIHLFFFFLQLLYLYGTVHSCRNPFSLDFHRALHELVLQITVFAVFLHLALNLKSILIHDCIPSA